MKKRYYACVVDDERDDSGPLVFEQYLFCADKERIEERAKLLRRHSRIKRVRVAEIVFKKGETK